MKTHHGTHTMHGGIASACGRKVAAGTIVPDIQIPSCQNCFAKMNARIRKEMANPANGETVNPADRGICFTCQLPCSEENVVEGHNYCEDHISLAMDDLDSRADDVSWLRGMLDTYGHNGL